MLLKRIYYLSLIIAFCPIMGRAQNAVLLQKFRMANSKPNMSYDYRVILYNVHSKKNVDSMKGRLYVKEGQYIDSSNQAFTARVGEYFCKLDHQDRTATIGNITKLSKKVGIRIENDEQKFMFNITDSLIARLGGTCTIDSTIPLVYSLKLRLKNHPIIYAQIEFRRDNFKMTKAYFESQEQDPNNPENEYRTKFQMFNVQHNLDSRIFDLSRIYTIQNTKPILNSKYAKYSLKSLAQ